MFFCKDVILFYMDKRKVLSIVIGAVLAPSVLLFIVLIFGITDKSSFYLLEGTDLVIHAKANSDNSATISFFHRDSNPNHSANQVTIKSDKWQSLIVVDPSNTNIVYVESDISIESSSDIDIVHYDSEIIFSNTDALKYWYDTEERVLYTGSFNSSYEYIIKPLASREVSNRKRLNLDPLFIVVIFLLAGLWMALQELINKRREKNSRKNVKMLNPKQMGQIPVNEDIVYVKDIELSVLSEALSIFKTDTGLDRVYSNVYKYGRYYVITTKLDYDRFTILVNDLRYCNEKKKYQVVGWFKMNSSKSSSLCDRFCNETLMFYIPESDVEYDNVYILTQDGRHYKQDFSVGGTLTSIPSETRQYESQEEFHKKIVAH